MRYLVLALALPLLAALPESSSAGAGVWTTSGPTGGDVYTIVADPADPATVYLSTINQIYKSTNAGLDWSPLNVAPHAGVLNRLVMSPHDASVLLAGSGNRVYRTADAGTTWTPVSGGLPVPGIINDFTFDPHTTGRIWAVGDAIWISTDNGSYWSILPATGLPDRIERIQADPSAANRLFAIALDEVNGRSILRSIDGGLTWAAATVPPDVSLYSSSFADVFAFPATPGTVLAAAGGFGVLRSTDGGASFDRLPVPTVGGANADTVTAHPSDPDIWYVGTNLGLLRTVDGGANYSAIGAGIQPVAGGYSNGIYSIYVVPSAPATLYAGAHYTGFYASSDGGASWVRRNQGLRQAAVRAVAVHPSQRQWLYAGYGDAFGTPSDGLWRSTNQGASWFTASPSLEASGLRTIIVDPNTAGVPGATTLYAAGYGSPVYALDGSVRDGNAGVYKSTDGGGTWTTIDNGIPFRLFSGPLGDYRQSWFSIARTIVADPGSGSGDGSGPLQTLYLAGSGSITYSGGVATVNAARIYKSIDAGANWSAADNGLPIPDYDAVNNHVYSVIAVPLVIDPSDPDTLYVGTAVSVNDGYPEPSVALGVQNGVFKSVDGGANWLPSSTGLPLMTPGNPDSPHRSVLALALAPSAPQVLYAAVNRDFTDSRIYRSDTGGATWFEASAGIADDADIRALIVDPDDPDVAYAGSTGSDSNPGGVYRTIDGGVTWTSYSVGLPSSAVSALTLDTGGTIPRLYAGTRNGVFEIDQVPDEDTDGVPSAIEAAAPNAGDGNGDGVADTDQSGVASLPASETGRLAGGSPPYVTVELDGVAGTCDALQNVHRLAADQLPADAGRQAPFGHLRLDIPDCDQANLRITYHGEAFAAPGWQFRVYAPLSPDQPHSYDWRNFPAIRSGNTWTLELADNAFGDLRDAEGAILFQGGVVSSDVIFADRFE